MRLKKSILLLALLFCATGLFAAKKVTYEREKTIIKETAKDKMFQYNIIKSWVYETFKTTGSAPVLQPLKQGVVRIGNHKVNEIEIVEENPETGRVTFLVKNGIVHKTVDSVTSKAFHVVDMRCRIDVKDSKVRIIFSDINLKFYTSNGPETWVVSKKKVPAKVKAQLDMILRRSVDNYLAKLREEPDTDW